MKSTPRREPVGFDYIPKTPFLFPEARWDYTPVGMCRYELHGDYTESVWHGVFEIWSDLDEAVTRFAEHGLPQRPGTYCWVLDSNDVVVLGYDTSERGLRHDSAYGWWIGVGAAFLELERLHDPMEVAIWETMAKEYVW